MSIFFWKKSGLNRPKDRKMIATEILEEYRQYLPPTGAKRPGEMTEEEILKARELGELRKKFLKLKGKELGISAQKLEKNIGKALKKLAPKVVKEKKPKAETKKSNEEEINEEASLTTLDRELLPPEKNHGRGGYYVNSKTTLSNHLKATGGKWRTRFPPEPNGYLHIGHAKAMLVSFGVASRHGGNTIMRFDDTNPEAEKPEYIRSILRNVSWLGHKYEMVTYTSDYFEELFNLGIELIKRGKAYVCHQPQAEVKKSREVLADWHKAKGETAAIDGEEDPELLKQLPQECFSPYRNRSVEENLDLFKKMRSGYFDEGEATLRMKQNLLSPNANLWDQMAYRVMFKEHPRTGDKWCIYPTYDYSHCLIDSLENVTHSLCTLEFESRQSTWGSYHWLVESLGMYHAQTWEFSRCSISCNVMSKRRLNKLVTENYVNGWDDPRLLTLDGLKRRGYTPEAINTFTESTGIARSSNTVCIKYSLLEHFIRKDLNENAIRKFAIQNPVKLKLLGVTGRSTVEVPNFPQDPEKGSRKVDLGDVVYIPRHKFRSDGEISEVGQKGYKGLVKGGVAKLLNGPTIKCVSYVEENGKISEIVCEKVDGSEASAGAIPWVAVASEEEKEVLTVEARVYEVLFQNCEVDGVEVHAEKAAKAKGKDYIDLLNPDSLNVSKLLVEKSVIEEVKAFLNSSEAEKNDTLRWQFITLGYFCVDPDSTSDRIVLNRICSLKENKTLRK